MGEVRHEDPSAFDKKMLGYLPDSEAVERTGFSWPNEININDVFPFTEEKRGVGIGVGIDQMLEILTHSKLDEVVIVDFSPQAHLTTKALLEAGAHYRRLHGTYPSPEIFVSFFSLENIDETIRMVSGIFSQKQRDLLRSQLRRSMKDGMDADNSGSDPATFSVLRYKLRQRRYDSWLSKPDRLREVIERYERGKIHVCYGNVAEGNTLPALALKLADEGKTVSVAYLSNLDFYLGIRPIGDSPTDHLIKNLRALPLSPDAVIIRSEMDVMEEIPVPSDRNAEDSTFQKHVFPWRYDAFSLTDYETDRRALQNEIANSSR